LILKTSPLLHLCQKKWDKKVIDEEKELVTTYALKNKKEIRRVEFLISKLKTITKTHNKTTETQISKEAKEFVKSIKDKGFLLTDSLDDILIIKKKDILERRLSNIVFQKGLAHSAKQARQFIVHNHIKVSGKVISSPAYLVNKKEEEDIEIFANSALANEDHPTRSRESTQTKKVVEIVEDKKEETEKVEEKTKEVKE